MTPARGGTGTCKTNKEAVMRDVKKKGIVGWWRLTLSLVFLFNPNVGLVDLLPDFIGYLLLCDALAGLSFIDDRISEARTLLRRAALITLGRFAALFITFGLIPYSDRSTMMLLLSFVFDIAELCTVIPAIFKLSEGILYISGRHDGEAAYLTPPRKRRKNASNAKNITQRMCSTAVTFAVVKAICGTIPELSALSGQGYDEGHWYEYIGMFRVLGFAVALVFGIVFLCRGVRYFGRLRAEKDLYERLDRVYADVIAEHPDYLARRAVLSSFVYFSLGAVFAIDFGLDGLSSANGGTLGSINVIPDVLSAVCILAGVLVIKKYITNRKITLIFVSAYAVVTAAYMALQYHFASVYYVEAVGIDPETTSFYMFLCAGAIACTVLFAVMIVLLMRLTVCEIIRSHTGFSITSRDSNDPGERVRQLHRELSLRTIPIIVVGIFASMLEAASVCLVGVASVITLPVVVVYLVECAWILALVVDVVYAVMFIKLLGELRTQIDYKYMLS